MSRWPQQPVDAARWRERLEEGPPNRCLVNDTWAKSAYCPATCGSVR